MFSLKYIDSELKNEARNLKRDTKRISKSCVRKGLFSLTADERAMVAILMTAVDKQLAESRRYFAAANSAHGFYSCFPDIFSPGRLKKIYIVKGGPGTGKSTFMRKAASAAAGAGENVDYYYCSSDTSSLDGIVLLRSEIAILDGTAPHMTDPIYPGAVEEIINMGDFFNTAELRSHTADIKELNAQCAACHRRAAHYLYAANEIRTALRQRIEEALKRDKMEAAAARILHRLRSPEAGEDTVRFTSAIGTKGIVHFDTARLGADYLYQITDKRGAACFFLDCIKKLTDGTRRMIYPYPLNPEETEEIGFPEGKAVFTTDRYDSGKLPESGTNIINMERFLDHETIAAHKQKIRFSERCFDAMMEGALESLSEADRHHNALEKIYVSAMDFEAQTQFTEYFIKNSIH